MNVARRRESATARYDYGVCVFCIRVVALMTDNFKVFACVIKLSWEEGEKRIHGFFRLRKVDGLKGKMVDEVDGVRN